MPSPSTAASPIARQRALRFLRVMKKAPAARISDHQR
jgi:hypothetical protein